MKTLACIFLIGASLAADEAAQTAPRPAAKPAPAAARQPRKTIVVPTVPKGAVQTSPGLFRWTDPDGQVWMYRSTPFGVSKWQVDAADPVRDPLVDQTTAVETGDSIRFERATPFGKHVWVRKKTDLDDTEQRIWARQQRKGTAAPAAEKE